MSPLFYLLKHGAQISTLLNQGKTQNGHLITDLISALAPVIKQHWPQYNESGLIDDTIAMLKGMLQ